MLLFNRIVLNRHIPRQIYRLIFKPKFWRREFPPHVAAELDRGGDMLIRNEHRRSAQGMSHRADPP